MKTDTYLSLAIEQAAKSPLHYRHGCIIVRGGKVIGQGFNDYRPGFNGGALKHGRIAHGSLDGQAIADLKEKLKKQKERPKDQQRQQSEPCAVEAMGGGPQANGPLSMHSEMMAIHSALGASSSTASSTFSHERTSFKLPRGNKRKARLRRELLEKFKSAVLKLPHLDQTCLNRTNNNNRDEYKANDNDCNEYKAVRTSFRGRSLAFQAPQGMEKQQQHHQHRQKQKHGKKNQYAAGQYGSQPHLAKRSSSEKRSLSPLQTIRGYDSSDNAQTIGNDKKANGNRSRKATTVDPPHEQMLLPIGQTTSSLKDREKHSRLLGADLYVARLGSIQTSSPRTRPAPQPRTTKIPTDSTTPALNSSTSPGPSSNSLSTPQAPNPPQSLHDLLTNPHPTPSVRPTSSSSSSSHSEVLDKAVIRASRPCYRCIAYMHSVGIKRVFWTNDRGEWEGAKVRDLMDGLDVGMEDVPERDSGGAKGRKIAGDRGKKGKGKVGDMGSKGKEKGDGGSVGVGGGPMGNGLFVTKHEVLMLRRKMGGAQGPS